MRGNKRYSNATFTKRVDHEAGAHRGPKAAPEPAVCPECGAVLVNRRWVRAEDVDEFKEPGWRPAAERVCPACRKAREGLPEGIVTADGAFVAGHRREIEGLLENEERRARELNPLARVIAWNWIGPERLVVSTTTPALAQRFGRELERSFGGATAYDFSHENRLARVHWHRE